MDQKRLLLAIALSVGIMLIFQFAFDKYLPHHHTANLAPSPAQTMAQAKAAAGTPQAAEEAGAPATGQPAPTTGPRLKIAGDKVSGSVALTGAIFDDVVLKDYHETIAKDSPLVQVLGQVGSDKPYYAQFGWTPVGNIKVPNDSTVWSASSPTLTSQQPVTLSWDNGAGIVFQLLVSVDDNYMFSVKQQVVNHTGAPVKLFPWSRIVRDYKPVDESSSYILYNGPLGVFNNTLHQISYDTVKSDGKKAANGQAYSETHDGGWVGITDKYWLTALAPEQSAKLTGSMSYGTVKSGDGSAYQTSFITAAPQTVAPGATETFLTHFFAGAKVVKLLDAYQHQYGIPNFYKSVDFGILYFITKPIFFCLDWLNSLMGNFGLAIMVFTVGMKLLFFPLASYSYRSMGKMKLVQPKIKALREQYKDDQAKLQQATMALYKTEKINPASGCLPMLVQIPIFFCLYKVIYITIEMRQAPFYGWIH
ncbi:MAG: membrane protein insertase YidC, partial [Acidocella sp. 20-61-6]